MVNLKYGLYLLNSGESAYARTLAELAQEAEGAGWDGFFLSDTISLRRRPSVDPFIALAAIAMTTRRIRIGTLVTPLSRRRPWKVARETVSIDHLSNGRLILGVGSGEPDRESGIREFGTFGEDSDARVRAEKLDEALDILVGLWSGEEFSYEGKHWRVDRARFLPLPVQEPRIPIWVGGYWPHRPPFRRAARWEGVIPAKGELTGMGMLEPADVREILRYVAKFRTSTTAFDVAISNFGCETAGPIGPEKMRLYAEEGLTWWLESLAPYRDSPDEMRRRIRQGPPRDS